MIKTNKALLLFIPAILIAALALFIRIIQYEPLNPSHEVYEEIKKQQATLSIPIYSEDPIIGSKKAPHTIIAFSDYGCDGCKSHFMVLEKLMAKHPDKVKIIWKGLPVTKFPHSTELAHKYAFCINEQDEFNDYYKIAFANGNNLTEEVLKIITEQLDINEKDFNTCVNSSLGQMQMEKIEQLAFVLNIQHVPTMFINNKQIDIPELIEDWEILLGL